MYLFTNENISIRKMNNSIEDKSLLLEWLTNPEVLKFAWGEGAPWDMQKIEDEFCDKKSGSEDVTACMIEYDGRAIGYIQYYPVERDSYAFNEQVPYEEFVGGYGIDLFVGYPELWGKGIGVKIVSGMSKYLLNTLGAKVVCADPEEDNQRSVRCWIKAGFIPVGKIQNYDDPEKISILMAIR